MVISARLGNKFITTSSTDERPCVYIYLVDDDHFHAVNSLTGLFSSNYFCQRCLKHYDHREKRQCDTTCIVCKRKVCPKTQSPVRCADCHMECRSDDCYRQHNKTPMKKNRKPSGPFQCEKWWKCPTYYKTVIRTIRKVEDHTCREYQCSSYQQYVLWGHRCYMRATPYKPKLNSNFIFFDFECSQDEISTCHEGYAPSEKECQNCQPDKKCTSCRKCQNCKTAWCGRT